MRDKLIELAKYLEKNGAQEEAEEIKALAARYDVDAPVVVEKDPEEEKFKQQLKEEGWQDPQVIYQGWPGSERKKYDTSLADKVTKETIDKCLWGIDPSKKSVWHEDAQFMDKLEELLAEKGYEIKKKKRPDAPKGPGMESGGRPPLPRKDPELPAEDGQAASDWEETKGLPGVAEESFPYEYEDKLDPEELKQAILNIEKVLQDPQIPTDFRDELAGTLAHLRDRLKDIEKLGPEAKEMREGLREEMQEEERGKWSGLLGSADILDKLGAVDAANSLDKVIKKVACAGCGCGQAADDPIEEESFFSRGTANEVIDSLVRLYLHSPHRDNLAQLVNALEKYSKAYGEEESEMAPKQAAEGDEPFRSEGLFKKLAEIADKLDAMGAVEEANTVDKFMQKYAEDVDWKDEADTEQSKRYDSKHHHSLQIREPKRDQERVDREGRKDHSVSTYQQTSASALSTRYCPEHIGVQMARVGISTYQCPLDGQVYNWETGWTDYNGEKHPGGSVAAQTPDSTGYAIPHRIFDSREQVLNRVN